MTHDQALKIFDMQFDNLQRAGVKIRMFHAMRDRNTDILNSDDEGKQAIIRAEMVKAVQAELFGDKLPA